MAPRSATTVSPRVATLPKSAWTRTPRRRPECRARSARPTKRASRLRPSRMSMPRLDRSVAVAKFAETARMTTPSTIETSSSIRVKPMRPRCRDASGGEVNGRRTSRSSWVHHDRAAAIGIGQQPDRRRQARAGHDDLSCEQVGLQSPSPAADAVNSPVGETLPLPSTRDRRLAWTRLHGSRPRTCSR